MIADEAVRATFERCQTLRNNDFHSLDRGEGYSTPMEPGKLYMGSVFCVN